MRRLLAFVMCLGSAGLLAPAHPVSAGPLPTTSEAVQILLKKINQDRAAAHLAPLHLDRRLSKVARYHSTDMALQRYLAHIDPQGFGPYARMAAFHIRFRFAGENLGMEAGRPKSVIGAIDQAMLRSPGHRANVLSRQFTRIGLGITYLHGVTYITEDFTD